VPPSIAPVASANATVSVAWANDSSQPLLQRTGHYRLRLIHPVASRDVPTNRRYFPRSGEWLRLFSQENSRAGISRGKPGEPN